MKVSRTKTPSTKSQVDRHYVTVVSTQKVCGKTAKLVDGAIKFESNGDVVEGTAQIFHVPTPNDLLGLLSSLSSHNYIIPDYIPSLVDHGSFQIITVRKYESKFGDESGKPAAGEDGKIYVGLTMTENVWEFGAWRVLDRDVDSTTPEQFRVPYAQWLDQANELLPGLLSCARVWWPSSKTRVVANGSSAAVSLNGHTWIDCTGLENFKYMRDWVTISAFKKNMLWSVPRKSKATGEVLPGKGMDKCIFDTAIWTLHRIIYAGAPTVGEGLTLLPPKGEAVSGSPLDLSTSILEPTEEDIKLFNVGVGVDVRKGEGGDLSIHDYSTMTLDSEVEIENHDVMTVQEFLDAKDLLPDRKYRCQAMFRQSSSWNGIIRKDAKGRVFHHDNGTRISYHLGLNVDIIDRYVFVKSENAYFDTIEKSLLSIPALNHDNLINFPGVAGAPLLSTTLAKDSRRKSVTGVGFLPTAQDIYEYDGKKYVNTYSAPTLEPMDGDVGLWLELMQHIYGEHTELVMDHMAFTVQKPDVKIRWQVLVEGKPRTGKTMTVKPLSAIFGRHVAVVSAKDHGSQYDDHYAEKKIIIFEEVWGDKRLYNTLKPKLANDDVEHLNPKSKAKICQRNLYSMYMFSNHADALAVDAIGDKLLIINGPDDAKPREFYEALGNEYKNGMFGRIYGYLLNRDISKFPNEYLPLRTEAAVRMAKASAPEWEQVLTEAMEDELSPFDVVSLHGEDSLMTTRDSIKKFLHEKNIWSRGYSVEGFLRDCGFSSIRAIVKRDGKTRASISVYSNSETLNKMPEVDQFDALVQILCEMNEGRGLVLMNPAMKERAVELKLMDKKYNVTEIVKEKWSETKRLKFV
jgi:hypothetical protein